MRLAGFVLVGGNSARMGQDKARLRMETHLLIEDVAVKVAFVAGNVTLVGATHRYQDLSFACLADQRVGQGPLGGVEAALSAGLGDWNLIVACDLPGLHEKWLQELVEASKFKSQSCIVCQDRTGTLHPLCGIWHASCLPIIQNALNHGRLRMMDILRELAAETVMVNGIIANVNTPEEWRTWQIAHGRQTPQLS
jgi:molybdenum cofactor guanylyltransferase